MDTQLLCGTAIMPSHACHLSLLDPMYLKMQQNLVEKHEAEKEGKLE